MLKPLLKASGGQWPVPVPQAKIFGSNGSTPYLRRFDADTKALESTGFAVSEPSALAVSPDNALLAYVEGNLKVRNIASGALIYSWPINVGSVFELAFSPDGSKVALVGNGGLYLEVIVLATGESISLSSRPSQPRAVRFNAAGTRMAVGGAGTTKVQVYRVSDWATLWTSTTTGNCWGLEFSPDNARLYIARAANPAVQAFNPDTGASLGSSYSPSLTSVGSSQVRVRVNSAGTQIAIAQDNYPGLALFRINSPTSFTRVGAANIDVSTVGLIEYLPDGSQIAAADFDNGFVLYHSTTFARTLLHADPLLSGLACSPQVA